MANRKPELLPILLVLRLLCRAADGQPPPLNDGSLPVALDRLSRADDLERVLATDMLAQGVQLDLSTASYNKAVADLYRRELENHFDPVDNDRRLRRYTWSGFVNDEQNERLRAVYGAPSMEARALRPAPTVPEPSSTLGWPSPSWVSGKDCRVVCPLYDHHCANMLAVR